MNRVTKNKVGIPTVIDPEIWFTLSDIVKRGMFKWARSFWSVRKTVELDRKNTNILRAIIIGTGRGTKYKFKGENIINFIQAVEAGNVRL